jgi:hypothetical protein
MLLEDIYPVDDQPQCRNTGRRKVTHTLERVAALNGTRVALVD